MFKEKIEDLRNYVKDLRDEMLDMLDKNENFETPTERALFLVCIQLLPYFYEENLKEDTDFYVAVSYKKYLGELFDKIHSMPTSYKEIFDFCENIFKITVFSTQKEKKRVSLVEALEAETCSCVAIPVNPCFKMNDGFFGDTSRLYLHKRKKNVWEK